jgi:hypothetical protein
MKPTPVPLQCAAPKSPLAAAAAMIAAFYIVFNIFTNVR